MKIDNEVKLDFNDVLIRPKRSTLGSRSEVNPLRTIKFANSRATWTGVPIMASNMDTWVRNNSDKKFDVDGKLALSGARNEIIFEQAQELYTNRNNKKKLSFDTNDFDISFIRGLSFEDGVTTLTDFTASILSEELSLILNSSNNKVNDILLCGGGRKNKELIKKIKKNLPLEFNLKLIDDYKIDGDFIESQAFAFLAVRSILRLPISFPSTTGCTKPCIGGELVEN